MPRAIYVKTGNGESEVSVKKMYNEHLLSRQSLLAGLLIYHDATGRKLTGVNKTRESLVKELNILTKEIYRRDLIALPAKNICYKSRITSRLKNKSNKLFV